MTRVLVVGAGIGGLALHARLRRLGLASTLVERASSLGQGGHVIALWPSGVRALAELGIAGRLAACARTVQSYAIADDHGRVVKAMSLRALNERHGPLVQLHRADLHRILAELPEAEDVALATSVHALEQHEDGVEVTLSNGRSARFDVVVGADGIRSEIRHCVWPELGVRPFGAEGWAFFADADDSVPDGITELWGDRCYFGVYRYRADRCGVYCATASDAGERPRRRGDARRLRAAFAGFGGCVPGLLAQLPTDPRQLFHDALVEVALKSWTRGRVALLGDAAHAMLPFGGMGASMALEDALVLADELAAARAEPRAGLVRYERRRRGRVRPVQWNARIKGIAMLRGGGLPLGLRALQGICRDPFAPLGRYATWQERMLDRFLCTSP